MYIHIYIYTSPNLPLYSGIITKIDEKPSKSKQKLKNSVPDYQPVPGSDPHKPRTQYCSPDTNPGRGIVAQIQTTGWGVVPQIQNTGRGIVAVIQTTGRGIVPHIQTTGRGIVPKYKLPYGV